MYIYRIRHNNYWKDYSNKYQNKEEALKWYNKNKHIISKVCKRDLVLFKNSKKVK